MSLLVQHKLIRLPNIRIESSPWIHNIICESCGALLAQVEPFKAVFYPAAVNNKLKQVIKAHQDASQGQCLKFSAR